MAIGQPDRNTMLLSLLSRQRGGLTGRRRRLPHSRYSLPNPMVSPEMSDADITPTMPSSSQRPDVYTPESAGVAPAPTGQGVGIGPVAGLAKGAIVPALGKVAFGLSNPVFGKMALAKFVYNSIKKGIEQQRVSDFAALKNEEDETNVIRDMTYDIDPDVAEKGVIEGPLTDPSDVLSSLDEGPLPDPSNVLGLTGSGDGDGGNVGGSGSPGGFGGPLGGGGQEGDAGASNTGTVGTGEAGDGK